MKKTVNVYDSPVLKVVELNVKTSYLVSTSPNGYGTDTEDLYEETFTW